MDWQRKLLSHWFPCSSHPKHQWQHKQIAGAFPLTRRIKSVITLLKKSLRKSTFRYSQFWWCAICELKQRENSLCPSGMQTDCVSFFYIPACPWAGNHGVALHCQWHILSLTGNSHLLLCCPAMRCDWYTSSFKSSSLSRDHCYSFVVCVAFGWKHDLK